jgi:hypothetical protein
MALIIEYTGTDIINQDDMSADPPPWRVNGVEITSSEELDPTANTEAYLASMLITGNSRSLRADNLVISTGIHQWFLWCRAGTVSSVEIGPLQGSFKTDTASIEYGPGSISISSSRAQISNLSESKWTLIKLTTTSLTAGQVDLYIYPRAVVGQIAGDSILIYKSRFSLGTDNSWSVIEANFNTLPNGLKNDDRATIKSGIGTFNSINVADGPNLESTNILRVNDDIDINLL